MHRSNYRLWHIENTCREDLLIITRMNCRNRCLLALFASMVALLGGCANELEELSAAEMFAKAKQLEDSADYTGAADLYNDIQSYHPFGPYAQQSLLNLAHLNYDQQSYEEAVIAANRFIADYPSHANLDYARYIKALSIQRDRLTLLDQIIFADSGNNSRSSLIEAHGAFLELLRLHPESKYAADAVIRSVAVINKLATAELSVAIHYLRLGAFGASLRRSSAVINSFPDSSVLEPALAILIASLIELKSVKPLEDAVLSLDGNFPGSPYKEPAMGGTDSLLAFMDIKRKPGDYFTALIE